MEDDMEIDAFAQKMLERTQARRDMINKRLPISEQKGSATPRQRDPLAEDKTHNEKKTDQEETLKRKSNDKETPEHSPKRRSVDPPRDKENYDSIDVSDAPTPVKGLAALKKKTAEEIAGVFCSNPTSLKVLHEESNPALHNSPHITHARSRLAALASDINQWEDDSSLSSERSKHEISGSKPFATPLPVSTPKSPAKPNTTISVKPACEKSVQSPVKEMVAVKAPQKEEPVKIQEKQEAQGFTKSASASKLSYKYEKSDSTMIKDRMKMFEQQNGGPTSPKKAATLPRKLGPVTGAFMSKPETPTIQISKATIQINKAPVQAVPKVPQTNDSTPKALASVLKPQPQTTPVNVDPSNLPLSARRAMFETPLSPRSCETPELLTVSQRAALFEKGVKFSPNGDSVPKPAMSKIVSTSTIPSPTTVPLKTISPTNSSSPIPINNPVNLGILKSATPSKDEATKKIVHFSPSKSVESHTAQLQQNLLEKINKSSSNDIASKMIEERKKELEELKNRWNRSPKKTFNPFDSRTKETEESDSDSNESKEAPTNEAYDESESSASNSPAPPPPPPLPSMGARYVEESPKSMTPQMSFTTESRLVCEKFDEMLDDVLNEFSSESEEEEGSPPRLYPSLSKLKKLENSPTKINLSPPKSIHYVEDVPPETTPKARYVEEESISTDESYKDDTPSMPSTSAPNASPTKFVNPISQKEESPALIHSISLYRRQNQQLSNNNTPVHVVKRNVEINLSPAHQEDNEYFEEVQERIKRLQEDLHRQDVQVKQACQALFLCAAKPEFFGSTEHVEGERLLLITTHKRNSCKNSIEQLKTEAALGFNPAGERGTLSISEIRLPLKQEFLQAQLGGQMHESIHYFFCLIRYREKVIATEMLNTKDGITAGTFGFSNHICLQDLRSNFSVLFEVYALQTSAQSVPHDRKYNIRKEHSKIKLTPKNKKQEAKIKASPALSTPEPRERSSNFDVVGTIRLNIDNCRRRILSLEKVPLQSPLEGRISMKLKLCTEQPIKEKGFLTMFEDVSGFGNWYRRWFVLAGNYISYWKYPDNEKTEAPMGTIDLRQCITPEVGLINPNICVRKHTFSIMSVRPKKKQDQDTLVSQSHNAYLTTEHRLSADTKEERILWCTRLNQALDIIRKWDPEALRPIELKT